MPIHYPSLASLHLPNGRFGLCPRFSHIMHSSALPITHKISSQSQLAKHNLSQRLSCTFLNQSAVGWCTELQSIFNMVQIALFIYSSVWGWYTVEKANYIPITFINFVTPCQQT